MKTKPTHPRQTAGLRARAEARLQKRRKNENSRTEDTKSAFGIQRLVHELEVHQIELEMQNTELQEARDRMEVLLEKYTDLYDFAPVGHLSMDDQGRIIEVNLTAAAMLGVTRSQLIRRQLSAFVASASQPVYLAFVKKVFAGTGKQICEAAILKENGASFWANFHGVPALAVDGLRKWCRMVISDISALKASEEAQSRLETMATANRELREEIARRQDVEKSLKKSERHQSQLLKQSHVMQEQLRRLSRQVLQAQEEERRRISREMHDVIAQTLTGINIRLATLRKEATHNTKDLDRKIARTQFLVERSVNIVHQFARELRPSVLDDLGLIPALHSFMKSFTMRTGIRTHLIACAGVELLDTVRRTVLFRVAQEALTNVGRHAQASRAEVTLQKLPNAIGMTIKDNGKSFQVDRVLHARGGQHLGLLGMRERLEMVGGHFNVASAPGRGTTISAQVLLENALPGKARAGMNRPE